VSYRKEDFKDIFLISFRCVPGTIVQYRYSAAAQTRFPCYLLNNTTYGIRSFAWFASRYAYIYVIAPVLLSHSHPFVTDICAQKSFSKQIVIKHNCFLAGHLPKLMTLRLCLLAHLACRVVGITLSNGWLSEKSLIYHGYLRECQ
jgi:hypothetical protein